MFADSGVLGADLLVWLVLALGAAMVVGYGLALVRPPQSPAKGGKGGRPGPGKGAAAKGRNAKGARPPARGGAKGRGGKQGQTLEAPRGRSFVMIGIGALATVWSLATLLKH